MKIGLIDVDSKGFPNLPLMKLSAYHKAKGDAVEWYNPLFSENLDRVYMSKVFSFTPDYTIYYDLIPETKTTAYGFLTRGCPRGCSFCHVATKEGQKSYKVADLKEFWHGQKNIELLDPNITGAKECIELFQQLVNSKACINFNQGLDVRLMTEEKARLIKLMKIKYIHMAWDRYEDKEIIIPKFKMFKEITQLDKRKLIVYVLTNYNTTLDQDLERIYTLKNLGYWAYVTIYNKDALPKGHILRKLQRYVNNRFIFESCASFDEYQKKGAY